MSQNRIVWLSDDGSAVAFPDVENALTEPDGLLAAGGDLGAERLLAAYAKGIFPWYEAGQPILWWCPDPRCVLWPADLHVSRRLRQQIRNSSAELRFNHSFRDVIRACAGERRSQQGTWITDEMIAAYEKLHETGWAHSVEIWDSNELVGGLYGICIGNVFFGESMFSTKPNTSKMAMLGLATHMLSAGLDLIDCQVVSRHLVALGARLIPRAEFTAFLAAMCEPPVPHRTWPEQSQAVARLSIA